MMSTSHPRQFRRWTSAALAVLAAGLAWIGVLDGSPREAEGREARTTRKAEERARRRIVENLKQIGVAIANYRDQHRCFPADACDKDGKPILSWRVLITPFLEETDGYDKVNFREPWNSPRNRKLLAKMPKVFAPPKGWPAKAGPEETFYQAFVGDSSSFPSKAIPRRYGGGRRVEEIPDGLAKTIMVVEGASPVHWAKPGGDLPFDPTKPLPKLGGLFPDGFHALFGDGHVSFIPKDIKPDVLKALITRNGKENVPLPLPVDEPRRGESPPGRQQAARGMDVFWSVRVADLWNAPPVKAARERAVKGVPELVKEFEGLVGLPPAAVERLTWFRVGRDLDGFQLTLVRTVEPYDRARLLRARFGEAAEEKVHGQTLHVRAGGQREDSRRGVFLVDDRTFLMGSVYALKTLLANAKWAREGPLATALSRVADKHLLAAELSWAGAKELLPLYDMPEAKALALTLDLQEQLLAHATLTFKAQDDAKAAAKVAVVALEFGREKLGSEMQSLSKAGMPQTVAVLGSLADLLKGARVEQEGAKVQIAARCRIDAAALARAFGERVGAGKREALRNARMNNLKQIGLAFHDYYDQHKRFPPPAIYGKDGKPLLSWRVAILPYIEQQALYKQFKLDEPWDSAHNKKLLAKMPRVYTVPRPGAAGRGETFYQGFVGKSAYFENPKGHTLADIPDGLSKTIAVVEAAKAVPWTKPEDVPFDPSRPVPKLGGLFPDGFCALFGDGHIALIPGNVKLDDLKPLITRNALDKLRIDLDY